MNNNVNRKEKGAMMVEATIYIPITVFIVIALLYLALFNMQEYVMMYEAQRVSSIVARDVAYVGYSELNVGESNEIDLDEFPSSGEIDKYMDASHSKLGTLYREIGNLGKAIGLGGSDEGSYENKFADAVTSSTIIAIGTVSAPEIKINDGLLGTGITVTFTHEMPVPGVLRYLGYKGGTTLRTAAYTYAVNPSAFVRNVDLACDMVAFVFDKLGISNKFDGIKSKLDKVLDTVL